MYAPKLCAGADPAPVVSKVDEFTLVPLNLH
jgi:hypothetical protein